MRPVIYCPEVRTTLFLFIAAAGAIQASGASCEGIASLSLKNASITATAVPAGPAPNARGNAANLPAFCRVAATLRPSSDSEIKMEIWLPSSNWNGKLEVNGNGGWSGSISTATLSTGLLRGYVTAMSDLGHEGSSASFAFDSQGNAHPEKLIDFGYRAAHEVTVASKAIVTAFYGNAANRSYWVGCSAGGRSAFMEAQRYPDDFDGIVAGAPGVNWTGRAIQSAWVAQAAHKDAASYIPPSKYGMIHEAALQSCDAADGLKDGVIENPLRCRFDPKELLCAGADGASCLTAPQVEAARAMYAPVINPRTKQLLSPGFERGSELGWATMAGPQMFGIGADMFKFVIFQNPAWDYRTFDFDRDAVRTATLSEKILNAMDPNLKAFTSHGKIIQYHGWADPQIAPANSVNYYQSVLDAMGGESKVADSYRLFMVPGMAHCNGGDGVSSFDMVTALEQWVEAGKAPDQIPASRVRNGQKDRTRPLCPYPQLATYKGSGNPDDAANFVCK